MPEDFKDYEEPSHWLIFAEITRLLSVFASLGLKRVRLTGGEPLLRKNPADLARYLVSPDGTFRIRLITPMSQHFCETCNRVWLGGDGTRHLCPGQADQVDFRGMLRSNCADNEIEQALLEGLRRKPARHEFREQFGKIVRVIDRRLILSSLLTHSREGIDPCQPCASGE